MLRQAQHVLAGDELFFRQNGMYDFMYPTPCAIFLAGASLLGQAGLILFLVAINSASWFISAQLAAKLAADQSGSHRIKNAWLYLVPSLLVIIYIWSSYHLGQASLVLLALMLGAFVALRSEREIFASALVAIAAAIKAFPVIVIVYSITVAIRTPCRAFPSHYYFCFSSCPRRSVDSSERGMIWKSGVSEC